jgi:hypothetical protein
MPAAGDDRLLVHIEAGAVGMQNFHDDPPGKGAAGMELPSKELS